MMPPFQASPPATAAQSTGAPHLLLRASAGTGKTYQLVRRYAELVLTQGCDPAEVVVITFTRKAAAELRQRIERRLHEAGAAPQTLAALAQAPIDTFHGLCTRLLGQHAEFVGAGDGDGGAFDTLGEANDDVALFVASAETAWLTQPTLAADVRALAPHMAVDAASLTSLWQAVAKAREDGREVTGALLGPAYDPEGQRQAVHRQLSALRQRMVDEGASVCTTATSKLGYAAFVAVPVPPLTAPLEDWARGWAALYGGVSRRGQLRQLITEDERDNAGKVALACLAEPACLALQPAWRRLLEAAWSAYVQAKQRLHCRDFADLIADVVRQLDTEPDWHLRLRQRVRAVMVDEAQDTNQAQRRLVHLLCGFAGPARAATPAARLVVVGDWKQCIYTFRGANPDNFQHFADDVLQAGGADETLQDSYRSRPALIDGINDLGAHLFGPKYEPLVARPDAAPPPSAPAASATDAARPGLPDGMHWFTVAGAAGEANAKPTPEPDATAAPTVQDEAERVADVVVHALAQGTPPGEVAVLLGAKKHAVAIAEALVARGVAVISSGGGVLYAQLEVRQWVSLLAWLADASCSLEAAVALRAPWFGLPDEALWALFSREGRQLGALAALRAGNPAPALSLLSATSPAAAGEALRHAARLLPQLVDCVATASPTQAMVTLMDALQVTALLQASPQAPQRLANFARLETLAARAERRERSDARAFAAEQLQRMVADVPEEEGTMAPHARQAVTLSTVHRSKGLQWQVVVLPRLSWGGGGDEATLYHRDHGLVFAPRARTARVRSCRYAAAKDAIARDEAAQLERLLYVAVTRAKAQVFFLVPAQKPRGGFRGFAKLLAAWQAPAAARGTLNVLTPSAIPPSAPRQEAPPDAATRAAHGEALVRYVRALQAPRPLPAGSTLQVTVTQLVHHGTQVAAAPANRASLQQLVQQAMGDDVFAAPDARTVGTLAHAALAYAMGQAGQPGKPGQAGQRALAAYLQSRGVGPGDALFGQLHGDLSRFLASPLGLQLCALDDEARRHEWPFVLTRSRGGRTARLRGQLDLLTWVDGAPVVVDFKNAFYGANAASYRLQLEAYAWAAAEACGYVGPVACYLVYLRGTEAPLRHVATPAHQAAAAARLEGWLGDHAAVTRPGVA